METEWKTIKEKEGAWGSVEVNRRVNKKNSLEERKIISEIREIIWLKIQQARTREA